MNNILTYVNKYGRWKDLLYICYDNNGVGIIHKNYELTLFANKLREDLMDLKIQEMRDEEEASPTSAADKPNKMNSVSLCAKWSPSENDRNDRRKQFAKKIATILYGKEDTKKMEKYRKEYLVPLRNKINIVETLMCNNEWDKINYEGVPGVASRRLHNAFNNHDSERYCEYLAKVRSGDAKINVTGILPHELAGYYINLRNTQDEYEENETIELQWKTIVDNVKNSGCDVLGNSLAIIDLSPHKSQSPLASSRRNAVKECLKTSLLHSVRIPSWCLLFPMRNTQNIPIKALSHRSIPALNPSSMLSLALIPISLNVVR
jgi:hypothetical protein